MDREAFVADIVKALQDSQPATLNEEELRWVRLAIQVEAQRLRLRQAIIEKTLVGLVWMFLVAMGYILLDYFQARGLNLRPLSHLTVPDTEPILPGALDGLQQSVRKTDRT